MACKKSRWKAANQSRDWTIRKRRKSHVHYRAHNSQPAGSIVTQMNPANTLLYHLCKYPFNIILPSTIRSSSGLFPSGYPIKTSTHHLLLDLTKLIIFGKERKSRSSSLWSLLPSSVSSPFLDRNIFLFSSTLSPCFCLNIKNLVSHPHNNKKYYSSVYFYVWRLMKNKYSLGQYPKSDISRIKEDVAKLLPNTTHRELVKCLRVLDRVAFIC
jgi:hypothetical protein